MQSGSAIKRKQLQTEVVTHWSALTPDDLHLIDGKRDNLIHLLERRYGFSRTRAEREAEWFYNQFEDKLRKAS
jgi:hypothetical protein